MGVKKLRELTRKTEILDTDIIPIASSTGGLQHAQVGDLNLLSDADKAKLDGIEAGAQKNTVTSVSGKTGAVQLSKADVGLSNVDNTSDLQKPISTATQSALNDKEGSIKSALTKSSIVDGDAIVISDSATTNTTKRVAFAVLKSTLKAYFDTLYTKYVLPIATASALGGVKSGTDITVDSSGNVSVNDDSHNHIVGNIDGLQDALNGKLSSTGNAVSATKLYTPRTINGVSFDGTKDITIVAVDQTARDSAAAAQSTANGKETAFTKNTAFNKNFGTAAGTVCQGDDARLSDARPANGGTSAACSGNAATATALTSSAGNATQPVYFSAGKPVATTYTLGKSVPSNAVFTDTTYGVVTTAANGLMASVDKTKLDGIADGANKTVIDAALSTTSENPVQNKVLTSASGVSTLINQLTVGTSVPIDADYFVSQYAAGGGSTTSYHRRPVSALWSYIQGKADVVYAKLSHTHTKSQITDFPTSLPANGGTSSVCSGNSATATKLQTPRKINGVLFDGTKDITIDGGGSANSSAVTLVTWTEVT